MLSWELMFGRLSGEGLSRQVSLLSLQSHRDPSSFGALAVNTERNRWESLKGPFQGWVVSGMRLTQVWVDPDRRLVQGWVDSGRRQARVWVGLSTCGF